VRILYHHRTRAGDAQGIHIHEIVRAFRELGHDVEVAALADERNDQPGGKKQRRPADRFRAAPAWAYELMSLAYNLYGYRMLRRATKARRPDLLYERYSLNTFCGVWAARRLGVPLILEVNAPLAYEQDALGKLAFRRLARFSERWICSNSTRTIVVTGVMKDLLVEEGVPRERIVVVTNGVDPAKFHPGVQGRQVVARHALEGKLVLGFVGWFRPWHGLEMLLQAFHDARLADLGARLLLVGDGPARPDLDRFIARNGLGDDIVFTGPVPHEDIPTHIAAMDVAVQPSAPEYACPMKIIEYMAMAKCVVAPDQPNIREIVEDGKNGLLFEAGNAAELKRTLLRALRESEVRQSMGRNAFETVISRRFLWKDNAERALTLARGPENA
jgi:glycosyltransferase involved in cell wall biosynthesis